MLDNIRGGFLLTFIVAIVLTSEYESFAQSASERMPVNDSERRGALAAEGVQTGPSGRLTRETTSRAISEEQSPYHLHFRWESLYVTEGRDNLAGAGIASVATEVVFGLLTFSPWYAYGYDSNYDELNLNFVLGYQFNEDIEIYAGYSHLRFFKDNLYDNEVGAGIVLSYLKVADFFATGTYAFDAGGTFIETGFSREVPISDQLTLKALALLGINSGYIWGGHDGTNNLQILVEASYQLNPCIELTVFAGQTWALKRDAEHFVEDMMLGDFFWSGAGLIVHF